MFLNKDELTERLPEIISPHIPELTGIASYDLRLGRDFLIPQYPNAGYIYDLHREANLDRHRDYKPMLWKSHKNYEELVLGPSGQNSFALGTTLESIKMPPDLVGFVSGISTLARSGLEVTSGNAQMIMPGFSGNITLEFNNVLGCRYRLHAEMIIAQISFAHIKSMTENYGVGKYLNQNTVKAPDPSKLFKWRQG